MSTLRERLEGKARARAVVHIPVSDPGEDLRSRARAAAERAQLAQVAIAAKVSEGITPETAQLLRAEADALAAELAGHYEAVEIQALVPADWEALLDKYRTGEDGQDLDEAALPVMLAACAVDESLRDEGWWTEQFGRPEWSFGEREALRSAVLRVNAYRPSGTLGKG